jgi:hypothetical protein
MIREVQLFTDSVLPRAISPKAYQSGQVNSVAGSTLVVFPTAFDSIPRVTVTNVSASTTAVTLNVASVSASSFALYSSAASTVNWIAVVSP